MRSSKIVIGPRPAGGKGLFAVEACARDEVLIDFRGYPVIDRPTRISLQVDEDRHIEGSEETNAYLNHGCDASAYYDYAGVYLRARRDIAAGEEVTVNYDAGDLDLHEKFVCRCGSPRCVGLVQGFAHLSLERQRALEDQLAPYLRRRLGAGGTGRESGTRDP